MVVLAYAEARPRETPGPRGSATCGSMRGGGSAALGTAGVG